MDEAPWNEKEDEMLEKNGEEEELEKKETGEEEER